MNAKVNYLRCELPTFRGLALRRCKSDPYWSSVRAKAFGRVQVKIDLSVVQCFSRRVLLGSLVVKDTRVLVVEVAKIDLRGLNTNISFFVGFPRVVSCHWCGSRINNRTLDKLYMVKEYQVLFEFPNCF